MERRILDLIRAAEAAREDEVAVRLFADALVPVPVDRSCKGLHFWVGYMQSRGYVTAEEAAELIARINQWEDQGPLVRTIIALFLAVGHNVVDRGWYKAQDEARRAEEEAEYQRTGKLPDRWSSTDD